MEPADQDRDAAGVAEPMLGQGTRVASGVEGSCQHSWQRRRDGRWCAVCGKVEFGEVSLADARPKMVFCASCRNYRKSIRSERCVAPGLPANLIDGRNWFPVWIARGFDGLCGPQGRFWQP